MSRLGMMVVAGAAVFAAITWLAGRHVAGLLDMTTDEQTLRAAAAAQAAKADAGADAGAKDAGFDAGR